MNITNFLILNSEGHEIQADAHCNNLAFKCQECDYPVLAATLDNQRGSDEKNPAICKGCGEAYFLNPREKSEKLYVFSVREYNNA
jgi:hypothetical protein